MKKKLLLFLRRRSIKNLVAFSLIGFAMLIANFSKNNLQDMCDNESNNVSDEDLDFEPSSSFAGDKRETLSLCTSLPIPIQFDSLSQQRSPTAFSFDSFRGNPGRKLQKPCFFTLIGSK